MCNVWSGAHGRKLEGSCSQTLRWKSPPSPAASEAARITGNLFGLLLHQSPDDLRLGPAIIRRLVKRKPRQVSCDAFQAVSLHCRCTLWSGCVEGTAGGGKQHRAGMDSPLSALLGLFKLIMPLWWLHCVSVYLGFAHVSFHDQWPCGLRSAGEVMGQNCTKLEL